MQLGMIWIISSRSVLVFFTITDQEVICLYLFAFSFKQHVNMALQRALAFTIERKIALAGNVCSKPPIIFRFHDLHASKIKKVVGR